ncbi:hypothetical protein P7K49_019062 [Saguinus oedipus]|uniref:Uncharacterized protein n=1 Tax=Saguinus oedipus TaxID=9490 RepID=A0ABQ9UWA6_SAGOE|nr:hypothetical protein P7K49_019062 [Saguinus oedipus]
MWVAVVRGLENRHPNEYLKAPRPPRGSRDPAPTDRRTLEGSGRLTVRREGAGREAQHGDARKLVGERLPLGRGAWDGSPSESSTWGCGGVQETCTNVTAPHRGADTALRGGASLEMLLVDRRGESAVCGNS